MRNLKYLLLVIAMCVTLIGIAFFFSQKIEEEHQSELNIAIQQAQTMKPVFVFYPTENEEDKFVLDMNNWEESVQTYIEAEIRRNPEKYRHLLE